MHGYERLIRRRDLQRPFAGNAAISGESGSARWQGII